MRVLVEHKTRLDYDGEVSEGVMDVRLGPLTDGHQRWERHDLRVAPSGTMRRYVDGFGNEAHLITIPRAHTFVELVAAGIVETLIPNPFAPPAVPPRGLTSAERFDYLSPSRLVALGDDVRRLAEPHRPASPEDAFQSAAALTKLIYEGFEYEKDVTNVGTTVPEVLSCRRGVCQDFAHVLLALCRALEIPARYVSGYLVMDTDAPSSPDSPSRGAGASHAWVDAWTPTHGWRGFDPTNNVLASERHVKMAIGRDYADVPPNRGVFRGSAQEKLTVEVTTKILD
ncbi:MAG TPA: transglutaminase family protein [Chloroflexota bacterium]|nr:transglutaminase family protein [Chloroflexota bacterium]